MADFKSARIGRAARGSGTEMTQIAIHKRRSLREAMFRLYAVGGPTTAYQALLAKQVDAVIIGSATASLLLRRESAMSS